MTKAQPQGWWSCLGLHVHRILTTHHMASDSQLLTPSFQHSSCVSSVLKRLVPVQTRGVVDSWCAVGVSGFVGVSCQLSVWCQFAVTVRCQLVYIDAVNSHCIQGLCSTSTLLFDCEPYEPRWAAPRGVHGDHESEVRLRVWLPADAVPNFGVVERCFVSCSSKATTCL